MGAKAPICTRSLRSPLKARISELKLRISELKPKLSELKPSFSELKPRVSELKLTSTQLKPRVSELKPKLLELKPKFSLQHDQDLTPKHHERNDPKTFQKIIKNRSKMGIWSGFEGLLASGSPQSPSGDPLEPSESRSRAQLRPNLSQLGAKLGSS